MFRLALQRKHENEMTAFEKQNARVEQEIKKSIISTSSDQLSLGRQTIYSFDMLAESPTSSLSHFYRISDFLELGENVWYKVEGNHIVFMDGSDDPDSRDEGPLMMHHRYDKSLYDVIIIKLSSKTTTMTLPKPLYTQ